MSDTSQGHGWWQATDSKWYPPELHPNYRPTVAPQATAVLPPPAQSYAQMVQPIAAASLKPKKPLWKRWWFIALVILIGLFVIAAVAAPDEDEATPAASTQPDTAASIAPEAPAVSVPQEAATDTAAPAPVATAAAPVATQPAPESNLTPSQQNAVRSAESYLEFMSFSRQGLIDQLSSEFGNQFPVEDATIAVDSLNVDWNEQAVESAQNYLEMSGFSCQGLIDQLSSQYGSQFTVEQATYGASQAGIC